MYGPVRTVVWQGSAGDRRPYADQMYFIVLKSKPQRVYTFFVLDVESVELLLPGLAYHHGVT